jgi:hypothetical protein
MNDKVDCANVIAHAFEWILDNLAEFDPFKDGGAYEIGHGQRLAELATMVYCYVEITGDDRNERIKRVIALLKAVQSKHEFQDRLLRSPGEFTLVCHVYAALRQLGHDNLDQRELIQRVIDFGLVEHVERLPHRMMELRMLAEWGNFRHAWPSWEALWESSILRRVPSVLYLDEMSTYALTHVIMFFYGFGTKQDVVAPCANIQSLRDMLSMLLVDSCQERHWDLLGELLLCWDCIGLEETPIYERAWETFLSRQVDGAFPGPEKALAGKTVIDGQHNADKEREAYFSHHYHTTLVGIIAASLHNHRVKRAPSLPHRGSAIRFQKAEAAHRVEGPSSDCSAAVRKVGNWSRWLLDSGQQRDHILPTVFYNVLLGSWMSDSILGSMNSAFPQVAKQVWQELMAREQGSDVDVSIAPPALRLIVAALLSSQGLLVPSLHDFLSRATEVLNETSAADALTDMSLCEKRVLLHSLGLHPAPTMLSYSEVVEFARTIPLSASVDNIEELLLRINSFTAYGTQRVTLDSSDIWIQELLAGLATHFFRQYDLMMACKLLRAMCYLDVTESHYSDAFIKFLPLHQRPKGAFGFFGIEESTLRKTMPQTFSLDLDLYLPVTVGCLWALGEASDNRWRLYNELPRLAPARS